ncbi:hypothetical protein GCM10009125_16350 [Castellaniella daejeonensis]|uniref:Uncharacterized protein n=1 Tax=Castellaniella daejeonensis TaxID=659013 RepID=A0ABN0TR29_9BURK
MLGGPGRIAFGDVQRELAGFAVDLHQGAHLFGGEALEAQAFVEQGADEVAGAPAFGVVGERLQQVLEPGLVHPCGWFAELQVHHALARIGRQGATAGADPVEVGVRDLLQHGAFAGFAWTSGFPPVEGWEGTPVRFQTGMHDE